MVFEEAYLANIYSDAWVAAFSLHTFLKRCEMRETNQHEASQWGIGPHHSLADGTIQPLLVWYVEAFLFEFNRPPRCVSTNLFEKYYLLISGHLFEPYHTVLCSVITKNGLWRLSPVRRKKTRKKMNEREKRGRGGYWAAAHYWECSVRVFEVKR